MILLLGDHFFVISETMALLLADPKPFDLTQVTLDSIAAVYFPRLGTGEVETNLWCPAAPIFGVR